MAKYKCRWDIKHDGKKYAPGDEIELTAKQARAMPDAVEKIKESPKKEK